MLSFGARVTRHHLLMVVALLAFIAWVYAPVRHASFVWDDWLDFHDTAWLREGDAWKHYVFKDFNGWTNYFRPLGVLLFTAEVRLFDAQPGPMHVVSLALHLINAGMVYAVARRFERALAPEQAPGLTPVVAMALYGLHPALVETVTWIGCQFEMLLVFFILLGLLAGVAIGRPWARAAAVSACFFFAAGSKESAAVFPLLLVIADWTLQQRQAGLSIGSRTRSLLGEHWPSYLGLALTGLLYLLIRHAALGTLLSPQVVVPLTLLGRIQEVCFLYLQNWRMLIWPMSGMGPIHPVAVATFNQLTIGSTLLCAAAIGLAGVGAWRLLYRPPGVGTVVSAITIALLPVLHLIAADFDSSLYHERYVMTALATACVLLPAARPLFDRLQLGALPHHLVPAVLCGLWLMVSVVNVRVTIPLWSNDLNLWRWALQQHPDALDAKENLLSAYLRVRDNARAHALIEQLAGEKPTCANCMLNAAILAIRENDPAAAQRYLSLVKDSKALTVDRQMYGKYLLTTGQMLFLQGKVNDSAEVLTAAMSVETHDPEPALSLAIVEARLGNCDNSIALANQGLALLPMGERESRRKEIEEEARRQALAGNKACRKP